MMNIHHLELFYYVARHKGITEAARNVPYGIQQPAISGQMTQLESTLGTKLFERRPFSLTSAGRKLYESILPFFSQLEGLEEEIRGEEASHLRLAAAAAVLTHHLPKLLQQFKKKFPKLRLTLRDTQAAEAMGLVARNEVDLALTVINSPPHSGVKSRTLLRLHMAILVPENFPARTFKQLAALLHNKNRDAEALLIGLADSEILSQRFQDALRERGIVWLPSVFVNSLELIQHYVASGFGCGIFVDIPGMPLRAGLRMIPLTEFPSLEVGFLYVGKPKAIAEQFMEATAQTALQLVAKNSPRHAPRSDI